MSYWPIIFIKSSLKKNVRSYGHIACISLGRPKFQLAFNLIIFFSEKWAITSTYLESDKKIKMDIFLITSQHFLKKNYIGWYFTFLCMQSVINYQRQGSIYDFGTI